MPKPTFDNLPQSKKKLVLQAAFEEFAYNDFNGASINRLIAKAGISKGSIYQYFGSKKELYLYLVQVARNRKMEYLQDVIDNDNLGFWKLFERLFEMGIKFDMENPLKSHFLYAVSLEWNNAELGNLKNEQLYANAKMFKYLLEKEKARGKLRSDVPTDLMGFMIAQMSAGIPDYISFKYGTDFKKNIEERKPVYALSDKEIGEVVKDLVNLMKSGLRASVSKKKKK